MFLNWPHVYKNLQRILRSSSEIRNQILRFIIRLTSLFIKHVVVLYLHIASVFVLVVVALDFVTWLDW